jgi:hypothetical protein
MELWPENDPIARLKHNGIIVLVTLLLATLLVGKYLEAFPPLMTLPITAKLSSVSYFFICLFVLLGLGIKSLSEDSKHKALKYGLGFWGFFIFAWLLWIGFKLLNIKADTSPPQKIEVIVIGKHVSTGKGGSSEYLDVVVANSKAIRYRFRVTSSVYFKSKVKDKFNLWYKKGHFNEPWVFSYKNLEKSS